MLLQRYKSTEVDYRTKLHVPSGLSGQPGMMLTKKLKYKKRLLLRYIHNFRPGLINNMDHMHVSGTEHSIVILSQTKLF